MKRCGSIAWCCGKTTHDVGMSASSLQPPGAGLPFLEWAALRYFIFPRACRRLTWSRAAEIFQREGKKILALWESVEPARLSERVLIVRLRGIEDSSRNWSVAMTVEHLNIVGEKMLEVATALRSGGQGLGPPVGTADVKPQGIETPAATRERFVALLRNAAELGARPAPAPAELRPRFPHPWFGPIDAHRWHCLNALHQRLHRTQIEAIRVRLTLQSGSSNPA